MSRGGNTRERPDRPERKCIVTGEVQPKYGLIRFGSQCDVFLPDALIRRVNVSPGQYVYAGETVIAEANIPTQPSA